MPINRASNPKELEPGLNALFGVEYKRYENEHAEIFDTFTSDRAYEEDVLIPGFGAAPTKAEGASIAYDTTSEGWAAKYSHETVALAFAITEEAVEDNLYDKLATRYTKALARSMAHTKQVKAANILNNAFSGSFLGGDGVALASTAHPLKDGGTLGNRPSVDADLSDTAIENALIEIAGWTDDRGIPAALNGRKLIIPRQSIFIADRILGSELRSGTSDNDKNVLKGIFPDGYVVNHRLTDPDAWYIKTDATDGLKHFVRAAIKTGMEGDFESGNLRYKSRERFCFGWSDPRALWATQGA